MFKSIHTFVRAEYGVVCDSKLLALCVTLFKNVLMRRMCTWVFFGSRFCGELWVLFLFFCMNRDLCLECTWSAALKWFGECRACVSICFPEASFVASFFGRQVSLSVFGMYGIGVFMFFAFLYLWKMHANISLFTAAAVFGHEVSFSFCFFLSTLFHVGMHGLLFVSFSFSYM